MSSDSEDDFSYTNTTSMLKALKKDISFSEVPEVKIAPMEVEDSLKNDDFDDDIIAISNLDETLSPVKKRRSKLDPAVKIASMEVEDSLKNDFNDDIVISILDDSLSPVKNEQSKLDISMEQGVSNKNDSCIILSDEDLTSSPANLISKIDRVLLKDKPVTRSRTKSNAMGRGRGKDTGRGRGRGGRGRGEEGVGRRGRGGRGRGEEGVERRGRGGRGRGEEGVGRRGRGRKSITRVTRQNARRLQDFEDNMPSPTTQNQPDIRTIVDNTVLEDANYEVDVKVMWMSQYFKKFSIRRFDKVQNIFQYFSERENIPENKLIFTIEKEAVILSKSDTPDSLNINAATIIEGGVRTDKNQSDIIHKADKDSIEIKIQFKDKKQRPLTLTIRRLDRMEVLMHKTAAELDVDVTNLKFYFDGDLIKSNDTVNDLQLEGGECIDCIKYN